LFAYSSCKVQISFIINIYNLKHFNILLLTFYSHSVCIGFVLFLCCTSVLFLCFVLYCFVLLRNVSYPALAQKVFSIYEMYVRVLVYVRVYTYVCTYVHTNTYACAYVCMPVYMCVCVCVPKSKNLYLKMILDSYEYIPVVYETMYCMT